MFDKRLFWCSLIIISFINKNIFAQDVIFKGKIYNSSKELLQSSNILAFPIEKNYEVKFAITNEKGEYLLSLEKGITYSIEVSYLGYKN